MFLHIPVPPNSSHTDIASWTVLYLVGINRVRLLHVISDADSEIFLIKFPVIFHSVCPDIRFPGGVGE